MQFVDTHCHLNLDSFRDNIHLVVDRAVKAGVNKIVVPGLDLETSERAVELSDDFECIYAAVGVHPNEAHKYSSSEFKQFERLIVEKKVVAVGEIGLDLYHHPETQLAQMEILESMLDLAKTQNKPVILHSRNALDVLSSQIQKWIKPSVNSEEQRFGVFHGFEGGADQGLFIQSLQMFLGIGGPVTFKNALDKQKVVKELSLTNFLLETDSPFLSPHPFRGQLNEPCRIPVIAAKIAELLEVTVEEVARITSHNAQSLFRWEVSH